MCDGDLEFPTAPLSPSLPSDFLEQPELWPKRSYNEHNDTTTNVTPAEKRALHSSRVNHDLGATTLSHSSERDTTCTASVDPNHVKQLQSRMSKWNACAREKKHSSDKASKERQHRHAAVLALDALVCFMIAFDYDGRAKSAQAGEPEEPLASPLWSSLLGYLENIAKSAQSVDADLTGLCYQVLGVLCIQVATYKRTTTNDRAQNVDQVYTALSSFRRGLTLLPLVDIIHRYGLNAAAGWSKVRVRAMVPDPKGNRASLPLHVNSSLAEAAAFALHAGQEWARQEGLDYEWAAANYTEAP